MREESRKQRTQSSQEEQKKRKKPKHRWGKYRGFQLFESASQYDFDCLREGAIQMKF
jgi:hypothetical protein